MTYENILIETRGDVIPVRHTRGGVLLLGDVGAGWLAGEPTRTSRDRDRG
jgi:hypothetical protein